MNVAHELARAKRTDDEIRFYRDVVESASQAGQIAAAIDLAALRGDLAGLCSSSSDTRSSRTVARCGLRHRLV